MAGFALVPSLLPQFTVHWKLSATEGGWLGGIFFLGYILAVPLLVSLTDRLDARRVYLACAALSGLALAGFALFTRSFEAALFWWWLAGLGLAGTYMPGLKALTDRLPVSAQSRGTAFYTATFGVGAGLSYLWVELTQPFFAWPVLFGIAAWRWHFIPRSVLPEAFSGRWYLAWRSTPSVVPVRPAGRQALSLWQRAWVADAGQLDGASRFYRPHGSCLIGIHKLPIRLPAGKPRQPGTSDKGLPNQHL
jgi:MFS family permease